MMHFDLACIDMIVLLTSFHMGAGISVSDMYVYMDGERRLIHYGFINCSYPLRWGHIGFNMIGLEC